MNSLGEFLNSLVPDHTILSRELTIEESRYIVSKINEYLYTNYENIGTTYILEADYEYFSDFHRFWEKHHREILNPKIDHEQCQKMAEILHDIYTKYDKKPFYELYDTFNLKPEEICKIRYFSANQDFRGSMNFFELAKIFSDDPSIFDKIKINQEPEDFLRNIGVSSKSQNDKRIQFAIKASQLLIDKNIEPYDLFKFCNDDVVQVRNLVLCNKGAGFGNKKADMFIRDMVVLGVWNRPRNFEKIDVASDINTIKVALRTGILKTDIALISSFLDIFSYQYTLIENMNVQAWREVWKVWKSAYPHECVESPSLIDYLVYRIIGKEFCKESLCIFSCKKEPHVFKWHSSRNKTCQICYKYNQRNKAELVRKLLPCTDPEGYLVIRKSPFVNGDNAVLKNIDECPFISVCEPKSKNFKKLNPPKSISILGQTGWDSAVARRDEGGGGLMA